MHDPTLRDALHRVEESYLEPVRIDPERMLRSALRAAGATGAVEVAGHGNLASRLAPPLEAVLSAGGGSTALRTRLLDGALSTLDPYSRALTGPRRRDLVTRFTGRVCGIGVRIGRREDALRVLGVLPGSSAEHAGLAPGENLLELDGQPVLGRTVAWVVARLRGPEATTVTLRTDRRAEPLALVRRGMTLSSVEVGRGPGRVGWIRLRRLSRSGPAELDAKLAELERRERPVGWVIDLRGNQGGSMLAAAAVADRFVARGTLCETADRLGRPVAGLRARVEARPGGRTTLPLAVLVDGRTASSAELLAAALVWNGRARLVGARTFGKNFVQKLEHYDEVDLTMRLSTAYLHAAGRRLPADGLVPEVTLPAGPAGATGGDGWLEAACALVA